MTQNLRNDRYLTLDDLRSAGSTTGEIDTVVVAFTDMQGRLQGKRLHGRTSSTTCSSTAPRAATTCSRSTST